jgi:hypothetical protein
MSRSAPWKDIRSNFLSGHAIGGKDSKQRTAGNVGMMWEYPGSHVPQGTRQIFILPPTQMGRRSAKIATRKVSL